MLHRLFIVDDDKLFTHIAQKIVDNTRLVEEVNVYDNGQEAYEYLRAHRNDPNQLPDVILLDLSMPILDGWGFLDRFNSLKLSRDKRIEVYVCSSSISPEDISKARALSVVSDYILKPLTRHKFTQLIEEFAERKGDGEH